MRAAGFGPPPRRVLLILATDAAVDVIDRLTLILIVVGPPATAKIATPLAAADRVGHTANHLAKMLHFVHRSMLEFRSHELRTSARSARG